MRHKITWTQRGGSPRQKPNPAYPHGVDLDLSGGAKEACRVELPYPTKPLIGGFIVECSECGTLDYITTAGRPDDPKSVTLACKK